MISNAVFGPAVQVWPTDRIWFGAGVELAAYRKHQGHSNANGVGFDARAGYTFNPLSKHTINASLEMTMARFADVNAIRQATNVALLLGYQLF